MTDAAAQVVRTLGPLTIRTSCTTNQNQDVLAGMSFEALQDNLVIDGDTDVDTGQSVTVNFAVGGQFADASSKLVTAVTPVGEV